LKPHRDARATCMAVPADCATERQDPDDRVGGPSVLTDKIASGGGLQADEIARDYNM
jgi:hypothetical protein